MIAPEVAGVVLFGVCLVIRSRFSSISTGAQANRASLRLARSGTDCRPRCATRSRDHLRDGTSTRTAPFTCDALRKGVSATTAAR